MKKYIKGWLLASVGFICENDDWIEIDTNQTIKETEKAILLPISAFTKNNMGLNQYGAWKKLESKWIPKNQLYDKAIEKELYPYNDTGLTWEH